MFREPLLPVRIELVAWAIVDDEKYFAARASVHDLLEEGEKRAAVEDFRELVDEVRPTLDGYGAEHVRCLSFAEGVDAWLNADARPGYVERAVEPEARLVPEHHDTATSARFFLIAGSRTRSQ